MHRLKELGIYSLLAVFVFISVVGCVLDIGKELHRGYDISSGLKIIEDTDHESGYIKVLDTDHIKITLSHGNSWSYSLDSTTSLSIYNTASKKSGSGGVLLTVMAFELDDNEYEALPDYSIVGESGGMRYIAAYPTDVQFDPKNKKAAEDYRVVAEEVDKVRTGGKDCPVIIK